jgi:hypothetical protein
MLEVSSLLCVYPLWSIKWIRRSANWAPPFAFYMGFVFLFLGPVDFCNGPRAFVSACFEDLGMGSVPTVLVSL